MRDATKENYHERILKVLLYIQNHLYEPMNIEDLAAVAYFSPYHFHRVFRGMVGETLAEHVRRLRLERAAGVLVRTERSVTDLAFEAGYENVESFTRAFAERFGQNPSEYRKNKTQIPVTAETDYTVLFKPNGDLIMLQAEIKDIPARKVAFVRHVGPYAKCGAAWETLCKWAGPKWLLGPKTQFIGLSYDDPEITPPEKIRYDACITLKKDVAAAGQVGVQEIAGGTYAVTLHVGPLEKLTQTYAQFCGQWLPQSGYELKNAPSVEIYLDNPDKTPPEKLRVEIQLPLESKN